MAGIIGYGAYIPYYRIKTSEIARVWGEEPERIENGLGIKEKAVAGIDEDAATIAVSAISLDAGGNLSISTISENNQALERLLADLTSEESFNKIGAISVESLSRGRDGTYRISLKMTSK